MSHTMRARLASGGLLLALLTVGPSAQSPETALRRAMRQEAVTGNLRAAIAEYEQIFSAAGTNRAVAAEALLHISECYRKLGDATAQRIYEQIVRDYADQSAAVATARARLGEGSRPDVTSAKGDRAVWTGRKVDMFGQVSPDGRFISYVDWSDSFNLMVHDVAANTDRALTRLPSGVNNASWTWQAQAGFSAFSKDGRQIAYDWEEAHSTDIRIVDLSASGPPTPRRLLTVDTDTVRLVSPFDWSADGKWLAVLFQLTDGTSQIARVSVADGSRTVLKSVGWNGPKRMFFSPDSRYLAYDLPAGDALTQRDIFVMAVDGSRQVPAIVHEANDRLLGWSPDGRRILFSSDRTGSTGLWSESFVNDKPVGAPELLRADIGASSFSLGVTAAGSLLVFRVVRNRDIQVAPIDLATGRLTGPPASFSRGFLPGPRLPDWSPDGKYLVYEACGGFGDDCLAVRSVDTGDVHKVPAALLYPTFPQWSPDGRMFLSSARDLHGKNGIFTIDAANGAVERIVETIRFVPVRWSPDGRKIYYVKEDGIPAAPARIVERDLATGLERSVLVRKFESTFTVSSDGRYIAAATAPDSATRVASLLVVPTAGGPARDLFQVTLPDTLRGVQTMAFTPDNRTVLVTKFVLGENKGAELWAVPLSGAAPHKLEIDARIWTRDGTGGGDVGFSLSPDGRHIAFLEGKTEAEVWSIENLLPDTSVATPSTTSR